jgi:hypothetical protein
MPTVRLLLVAALCAAISVQVLAAPATSAEKPAAVQKAGTMAKMDDAKMKDWLTRWQNALVGDAQHHRACDTELAEEIGWQMEPYMDGFYYGYMATHDTKWIDLLSDWADSWIKRAVKEPDGYPGWPKTVAAGTVVDKLNDYNADSLLGEAMALRPLVLMAAEIAKTPALQDKYGARFQGYLKVAGQIFEKWDKRGAWRDTKGGGMITVVMPFGIGPDGKWTAGYDTRNGPGSGFSHPDNKANLVGRWMLAMYDATHKPVYKERAEKWFKLMKSRMHLQANGLYKIWNYWEPAGPWDYKPDGQPKHWVGVHPNPGYYEADLTGIVDAYEHGVVFTKTDIDHLIATGLAEKRYWVALAPYNREIQTKFEETFKPDSWGGYATTPWYLTLQANLRHTAK